MTNDTRLVARPLTIFLHIPKTAGATVTRHLADALPADTVVRCAWFDEAVKYAKITGLAKVEILCSHLAAKELSYFAAERPLRLFTFLRDPVERVLSTYFFWRNTQADGWIETPSSGSQPLVDISLPWEEDFVRLLENRGDIWKYRELSDLMVWQLGHAMYERSAQSPKTVFDRARNLLEQCFFVGFQDRFEEDLARLFRVAGWPVAPIDWTARVNRSNFQPTSLRNIDPGLVERIRRANRLDIEFYEWACKRFRQ